MARETRLHTIGHSTHPIDEFLAMLGAYSIERLIDIRTVPGSRRNPQFGQESLRRSLASVGIEYRHEANLGGLRRASPDSGNTGWRNTAFRGFADYMQTEQFRVAIEGLIEEAAARRVAIMCAEAVPWRCHRSLVGDALFVRGVEVLDILSASQAKPHVLTPFARVVGTAVSYPGEC